MTNLKQEAPERIWLPRKDAPYVPNAEFYTTKDHPDDIEYVRADAADPNKPFLIKHGETEIFQAVWDATKDFGGILSELQRDAISVATVVRLRALITPSTEPCHCAAYGHPPHEPGKCPEGERFTCTCGQTASPSQVQDGWQPIERLFEAKLFGFNERRRIRLCAPCLRRAMDDNLVIHSCALPLPPPPVTPPPTHRCNGVNGAERHGTQNKCTDCGEYREGWYDASGVEVRAPVTTEEQK